MSSQKRVGNFILQEALGTGSFATVYRGVNPLDGESVAIKAITISRLTEEVAAALETEIRLQSGLSHPNIVKLLNVQRNQKYIFLTLELCSGGDLTSFVRRNGPLDEVTARRLMIDLAAGLKYLHDRNLAHRDIKPQNLLLSSSDISLARLRIADFGFARSLPAESLAHTLVGSPLYMAPELLSFKPYNTRADLWSVGVVLSEMLIGRPPFTGANPLDLLSHILANPWLQGTASGAAIAQNAHSCGGVLPEAVAERVSPACKAVLRGLLRAEPEFRMTHEQFFASEWLSLPAALGWPLQVEDTKYVPSDDETSSSRRAVATVDETVLSATVSLPSDITQRAAGHGDKPIVNDASANVSKMDGYSNGAVAKSIEWMQVSLDDVSCTPKAPATSHLLPSAHRSFAFVTACTCAAAKRLFDSTCVENSTNSLEFCGDFCSSCHVDNSDSCTLAELDLKLAELEKHIRTDVKSVFMNWDDASRSCIALPADALRSPCLSRPAPLHDSPRSAVYQWATWEDNSGRVIALNHEQEDADAWVLVAGDSPKP